jgi:opacity protein-like surface antigen
MGKHTSSKGTAAAKTSQQQQASQMQNESGEYSEDQAGSSYTEDMSATGDKTSDRQSFGGGSQR